MGEKLEYLRKRPVWVGLVLIPESNFSRKTSRKARKLFDSVSFVNWICLCILLRLLKKMSIQVVEKEVGTVKVAKQSSTYRQKLVGAVGGDFKGFVNDVVHDDVSH